MTKMKIAMVYDAIYPWIKGGGEKRIYELSKRLAMQGHEVHIFGIKWWNGSNIIENENVILHGVCEKTELYVHGRRSISEALIFSIKLLPHLYKEKFDIIDVTAFPYFSCFTVKLVSIFRKTPMIITWHEVWRDYWYEYIGTVGFFGKIIEAITSKLTSKSIVVSNTTKNNLKSLGIDSKNIHIIPNGIDLRKIIDTKPSDNKCDIIFIGRLIKEKNVDILLDAIYHARKMLPDIDCNIIGNGPDKKRLVRLTTERGLTDNVRFSEFMEYDEIIAQIKSSKVLVLPSEREGFGMVVLEALACRVPVITVKCSRNAASELVNESTGFVVNLNVEELSNAIYTLINMKDEYREKMSRYTIDAVQIYDWEYTVKELYKIYEEKQKKV